MKKIEEWISLDLQCGHRLTCKGKIPTGLLQHVFSKLHYHCHIHHFEVPIQTIVYKHPKDKKAFTYEYPDLFIPLIQHERWHVEKLHSKNGLFAINPPKKLAG